MSLSKWRPVRIIGAAIVLFGTIAASFYITFRAFPEAHAPSLTQRVVFNASNRHVAKHLVKGWSSPEGWGTWSIGGTATMRFVLDAPTLENVSVRVSYKKLAPTQSIRWTTPGGQKPFATTAGGKGFEVVEFRFEKDAVNRAKEIVLVTIVDLPMSPKSVGLGSDERLLGAGVEWAEIGWRPEFIYER